MLKRLFNVNKTSSNKYLPPRGGRLTHQKNRRGKGPPTEVYGACEAAELAPGGVGEVMGESLGEMSGEVLALPPRSCRRRSDGRRAPTRVPGARVDRQPAPAGKFGEWPPKLHVRGHVELRHRFDLNLNDVVKFLWYCPNIYSTRASRSWTSSEGVKTSSALSSVPESRHGCVSSTTRTTRTMSPSRRRH